MNQSVVGYTRRRSEKHGGTEENSDKIMNDDDVYHAYIEKTQVNAYIENSDFYEFYLRSRETIKKGTSGRLFNIVDILSDKFDVDMFENEHCFIQWVFPLPELSGVHPDATTHVLTEGQVYLMKTDVRVIGMLYLILFKILKFWGICLKRDEDGNDTVIVYQSTDLIQFLSGQNHNQARFTRMLKFLRCMGMHILADKLFSLLMKQMHLDKNFIPNEYSITHWRQAIQFKPSWDDNESNASSESHQHDSNNFLSASTVATATVTATAAAAAAAGAAYFLNHSDPHPQAAAGRSMQRHKR